MRVCSHQIPSLLGRHECYGRIINVHVKFILPGPVSSNEALYLIRMQRKYIHGIYGLLIYSKDNRDQIMSYILLKSAVILDISSTISL